MCRTASVAVRCSRPACSVGSPILGAAAASAVRPPSFRNRLRSSMGAAILYGAGVPRNRRPARALDTGVTLATGGARTPRFFGASAAQANGRPRWVEHCCSPASKRCPMTYRSLLLLVSLALIATLALAPLSAHAAGVPCAALTSVVITDTTITSATIVAALGTAPEHCLVIGHVDTEINFGHRAVHVVTVAGKKILHAFYGQTERLAYFEGCSNGGRQAMQEAERYPTDFDGIIAGAPALDWVGTMTGFVWNEQAANAASLPVAKVALLAGAVLAECDAKDGLMDGLISDPRRCRFDPKTLQCPAGDAPTCLTAGQVEAARRVYHGATSSSGRQLYFG